MAKQRIITFTPTDSKGNSLMSMGDVDHFEDSRQEILDACAVLQEHTWARVAHQDMSSDQKDTLSDACDMLQDLEAFLSGESI